MSAVEITDTGRLRQPEHPAADPWGIVHMVAHDLAAHGIKSRFGSESHFGAAAAAAAGLLSALGVQPQIRDDEPLAGPDDDGGGGFAAAGCGPRDGGRCHWLQAFDDAIRFRHTRAAAPCSFCDADPETCEDHARDLDLIAEYRRTARQLLQAAPDPRSSEARVTNARDLHTEHHQRAAMPPGELRALLARGQKRLRGLLDALGISDPEGRS